jgi:hypothetical protein
MILEDSIQQRLRSTAVIAENEVAMRVGDLYVAENVLTKERRQLSLSDASLNTSTVNESTASRGLLKG